MKKELETASASEVIPGYDAAHDWDQLSTRIPVRKTISLRMMAAAAGVAFIIVAGYIFTGRQEAPSPVAISASQSPWLQLPPDSTPLVAATAPAAAPATGQDAPARPRTAKNTGTSKIYNGTPCPIAIRINQVKSCPNTRPEPISTSSTLEPDGINNIEYEDHETVASNCSLSIREIEIKSIATGDVILLNSSSTPATVQDAFRILTRQHEGKILAGAFDHDCRKRNKKLNLQLDNRQGRLSIE